MLNAVTQTYTPLREVVYEQLKKEILTGKLIPGARMLEDEMAKTKYVSRTPIREAIRKLEKEGLVTIKPRKGAYVSTISVKDAMDALEVCSNVIGCAAYYAASRISKTQIQSLKDVSACYHKAVCDEDIVMMMEYDTMFYHAITEACGNKYLLQMLDQLQEKIRRFMHIYYKRFWHLYEMSGEHEKILKAIENGDGEVAKAAATAHTERLKKFAGENEDEII